MLEVESVEVLHLLGQYFLGYFICPEQVCREKGWSETAPGAERPCPSVYVKPYLMEKVTCCGMESLLSTVRKHPS